jgi:hypothetical protein
MRTKEEVAIAWIAVAILALPVVVLYPYVLIIALFGYCSYILYDHYSNRIKK